MAEAKLAKSLDQIIEENRKNLLRKEKSGKPAGGSGGGTGGNPRRRGIRVDGARKGLKGQQQQQQKKRLPQAAAPAPAQRNGGHQGAAGGGGGRQNAPKQVPARNQNAALGVQDRGVNKRKQGRSSGGRGLAPNDGVRPQRPVAAPVPRGNPDAKWQHDLYDDKDFGPLKRVAAPAVSDQGTKLTITNLDFNVTADDIKELFSTCGELKTHKLFYDRSGRSEGKAFVVYHKREDAMKAMKQYNNIALDGKRLQIELAPAPQAGGFVKTLSSGVRGGGGGGGGGGRVANRLKSSVVRDGDDFMME